MTFSRYICWGSNDHIFTVMNTDGEHLPDDVFLAVHSEQVVNEVANIVDGTGARRPLLPRDLLARFLQPEKPHVQMAVLGSSGSGKSHLIHWLKLAIPPRPDQCVVTVPRTGTTLRGVLDLLIGVLPAERQAPHRRKLDEAGIERATHEQRVSKFLDALAQAIEHDLEEGPRAAGDEGDAELHIMERLPHLIRDGHYRPHHLAGVPAVLQLVEHVAGARPGYQRAEDRRHFEAGDLPVPTGSVGSMADPARDIVVLLNGYPQYGPVALNVINRNLGRAITEMLRFKESDLGALMGDVRRSLHDEGKELVLLFEDFARTQGLDDALVAALLEQGGGETGLCRLRWAIAVTTGYYQRLDATARTRMDIVVDMDLPTLGEGAALRDEDVTAFAARYLNAARLPREDVRAWYERRHAADDGGREAVPNACARCDYRDPCHAAFGTSDLDAEPIAEVGLYPFNRAALSALARGRDALGDHFNPRRLIKDVLLDVLVTERGPLQEGLFPRKRLMENAGGSALPLLDRERLIAAGPEVAERQETVLQIWGRRGPPVEVDEGVYTAFDLPRPPIAPAGARPIAQPPTPEKPASARPEPQTQPAPQAVERRVSPAIETVRAWGRGGPMPDSTLRDLRVLLFPALLEAIDWDAAGLERSQFAASSGTPFLQRFISFVGQTVQEQSGAVTLRLPLHEQNDDERLQTAIALEGLLRFREHGHWHFEDGPLFFSAYAEGLERWSAELVRQFRLLPAGAAAPPWDPVPAAVEVLAVGAVLAGLPAMLREDDATALRALFQDPWSDQAPGVASAPLRELYRSLRDRRQDLVRVVRGWAAGTKAGSGDALLDLSRILPALKRVRQGWELSACPPAGAEPRFELYRRLVDIHGRVRGELAAAAEGEARALGAWVAEVRRHVGPETTGPALVRALDAARDAAVGAGLSLAQPTAVYDERRRAFNGGQFDTAVALAERLGARHGFFAQTLPEMVSVSVVTREAITGFLRAGAGLLDEIERRIERRTQELGDPGAEIGAAQVRIRTAFSALDEALATLGGEE